MFIAVSKGRNRKLDEIFILLFLVKDDIGIERQ